VAEIASNQRVRIDISTPKPYDFGLPFRVLGRKDRPDGRMAE